MLRNLDTNTMYYKPDLVRISQPKLISARTFFWSTEGCHCHAAISTIAHPRYPPDADPGHARRRVSCRRHRRRRTLPPLPAASRGRRNTASPPARASPSSAGWWDAICPPQRRHRCHCCAAISTGAHPRYPPDADPGHAR